MKYIIVSSSIPSLVEQEVNDKLKEGWKLHGETFVLHYGKSEMVCQAMIREEKDE